MSVFHRWFQWKSSLPESHIVAVHVLPPDIRDELVSASLLVLTAVAHIFWPVSPLVYCSVAIPTHAGVCRSYVGQDVALEFFFRTSESCVAYVQLDRV